MSYDPSKIAALSDQELKNLTSNVARLRASGSAAQRSEAERLAPLLADENERRKPAPKPRATRKVARKPKAETGEA
jgi:hypothetical protein